MRTPVAAVLVCACLLAGCGDQGAHPGSCNLYADGYRCRGNELQTCLPGGCLFGTCVGPTWGTIATCVAPQVCKIGANPELFSGYQNGCFDPGSNCSQAGFTTCSLSSTALPVDLWTCSRNASDGTLQWTLTRCDLATPARICLPDSSWTGNPPPTACYETAGTCDPSSRWANRCQGNVVYFCSGPTIVNGQAVFDWVVIADCAAQGLVCRTDQSGNGSCVSP